MRIMIFTWYIAVLTASGAVLLHAWFPHSTPWLSDIVAHSLVGALGGGIFGYELARFITWDRKHRRLTRDLNKKLDNL